MHFIFKNKIYINIFSYFTIILVIISSCQHRVDTEHSGIFWDKSFATVKESNYINDSLYINLLSQADSICSINNNYSCSYLYYLLKYKILKKRHNISYDELNENINSLIYYAKKLNNVHLLAKANYEKGNNFLFFQNLDSAAYYYKIVLENKNIDIDTILLSNIYSDLGILNAYMTNFPKAIYYQKKALQMSLIIADSLKIMDNLLNLARHFDFENEIDSVYKYIVMVQKFNGNKEYSETGVPINFLLGDYHYAKKSYDSALYYHNKFKYFTKKYLPEYELVTPYFRLARDYVAKGKTNMGKIMIDSALLFDLPDSFSTLNILAYYEVLFLYNLANNDNVNAIKNLHVYDSMKNEYNKSHKLQTIKHLEKAITKQQLRDKIIINKITIQRKNIAIVFLVITSILLVSIFSVIFYYRRKSQKQKDALINAKYEAEKLEAINDNQIEERKRIFKELHDEVGSPLAVMSLATKLIQDKLAEKENSNLSDEISYIDSSLYEINSKFQEIIWYNNDQSVTIQDISVFIKKYAFQFLQRFSVKVTYLENIESPNRSISNEMRKKILQTCKETLTNIVKHSGANEVIIDFSFIADWLHIIVKDNGQNFEKEKILLGNGIKNMKHNITSLGGDFNIYQKNGTVINISIPIS